MMTAGKDLEQPLVNIAQLSRAVGIHLIIATQRLTPQIVTSIIKANFPCRIACHVVCKEDSLIILDRFGAEKLLCKGNMLFSNCGEPSKFQGSWVDEITDMVSLCYQISMQTNDEGIYELPSPLALTQHIALLKGTMAQQFITDETGKKMVAKPAYDSMLEEVACSIVEYQASFVSFIQRKFALGYDRASSIMNQLESLGIVSSSTGGAREL